MNDALLSPLEDALADALAAAIVRELRAEQDEQPPALEPVAGELSRGDVTPFVTRDVTHVSHAEIAPCRG